MSRFVSPYLKYSIQARGEKTKLTADGFAFLDTPLIMCDFEPAALKGWEQDIALASFDFRGVPEGTNGPAYRLSLFDTDNQGYDEATKAEVESKLRNTPNLGRDYIELVRPAQNAPWPNYDTVTAGSGPKSVDKLIADKVRDDGYDVQAVIDYEEENANRPSVIEALKALLVPEGDEIAA